VRLYTGNQIAQHPTKILNDYPDPHPLQFRGNALAAWALRLRGWRVLFEGFPTRQGVVVVYPHTSNWDFIVMILAKWSVGVPIAFWGKDSLFKIPLFGAWLRWLGGVPVRRTAAGGVVGQMCEHILRCKETNTYFWLGLSPEGTRKHIPGWRSGFYQTAVGANVPLALIKLDYGRKLIDIRSFIHLSGNPAQDMARIASHFAGVEGKIAANASPVVLLDPALNRADTVVKSKL
jgi:1-acyl-sn-glycerol-3-phosphate acyltransferase